MRYTSSLLTPEKVIEHWPALVGQIHRGLSYFSVEMLPIDICRMALNGEVQIWLTTDENSDLASVTCTKIEHYPRRKILTILCAAGTIRNFDKWLQELVIVENFAQDFDCSAIRIYGRKGWAKRLARYRGKTGNQYLPQQQIFEMEL